MARFRHEALLYDGPDELVSAATSLIAGWLAAGDPVLVAVPERNRRLIRSEADDLDGVEFVEMEEVGRNPARIIAVWQRFLSESLARNRTPRGIGEPVWPERGEVEIDECERHEALLNVAFDGGPPWTLICPYDVARLPGPVIERAGRTHPHISQSGDAGASSSYADSWGPETAFGGGFPDPPRGAAELSFAPSDLGAVRNFVSEHALRFGLLLDRASDLVVAANEMATNSVRHGGGDGTLRMWSEGGAVVCEVRDAGRFRDPLLGRRFPPTDRIAGRGVWIANQLCDLVQMRSSESGSAVRLRMAQATE